MTISLRHLRWLTLLLMLLATASQAQQPTWPVQMTLVRYDEPLGFADGYGHTHWAVQKQPGPDAVDWPHITLNGRPVFASGPEEAVVLPLRTAPQNAPLLPQPTDDVLQPGDHRLRPLQWIWGQNYIYTSDRTARAWLKDYELWTFPVKIGGGTSPALHTVTLRMGSTVIYAYTGTLHTLTLMLPQNAPNQPYELSINGSRPVAISVGLQPVRPGDPHDTPIGVSTQVGGVRVSNTDTPPAFHYVAEWQADLAALGAPLPSAPPAPPAAPGFLHHLGIDAPRSPVAILAVGLPHGMSGGSLFGTERFAGTPGEYANLLSDTGYDADYAQTEVDAFADPQAANSPDRYAQLLAQRGIGTVLVPEVTFQRPFANNPNLAFEAAFLPDTHAPVYRDLQLEAQRMARYGNFLGFSIGADNAGYVPYWDWAPPIPNRPWAEAYLQFQHEHAPLAPVGGDNGPNHDYEVKGTAGQFADYLARYDVTWGQYGYFAGAAQSLGFAATSGSFGSSPGVGGRGGWPWASIPGEALFGGMSVQTAYDWNEQRSTLPMHLEALLDRLRSANPAKPTWAIVDDFKYHLTRLSRQRAYALALTRGVQAIGTTFIARPDGPDPHPQTVAEQRELYAWIHRYGGAYAHTRPLAAIGILYVQTQALMRPILGGEYPSDDQLLHGSHEGKVTEALLLCHAAGWPARVITPAELRRGLPPEMRAVLLVGLNTFDSTWHWYDTLTPALQSYVKRGGRLLRDTESVCPVPAAPTGLQIRAYVANRDRDWTPELLARNAANIPLLRKAMSGVATPVAQSLDPTVWAIPTVSGNTQYVTVVNQGSTPGQDAGQFVRGQIGTLTWRTNRPIYDVRLGRRLSPAEARRCNLTRDAFQWYALPPAPVTRPKVSVTRGPDGFYAARVTMAGPQDMTGIPVSLTLARQDVHATVYSATGQTARLPLSVTDTPGVYTVTVTELLTHLSSQLSVTVPHEPPVDYEERESSSFAPPLRAFAARRTVPLTIALTSEQASDPLFVSLASQLARYYRLHGRDVRIGRASPADVVLGLQPLKFPMHYPQWRTKDTDLVLFGTPRTNVLMRDEARALLLPDEASSMDKDFVGVDSAETWVVASPFVGERNVLNIIATNPQGFMSAVNTVVSH